MMETLVVKGLNINSLLYKIIDLRVLVSKFYHFTLLSLKPKLMRNFQIHSFFFKFDTRNPKDRNKHGERLLEFVRKGLICKIIEARKI